MFCQNCGSELEQNANFCTNCGTNCAPKPTVVVKNGNITCLIIFLAGIIGLFIMTILAALLLPAIASSLKVGEQIQCINNHKQIMLGMKLYARKYDGLLPDQQSYAGLEQLRSTTLNNPAIYLCPSEVSKVKAEPNIPMTEENISYLYFGAGKKDDADIIDKPITCCERHMVIGYGDWHIEAFDLTSEEFQQKLKKELRK